jgi:hypothetical protein
LFPLLCAEFCGGPQRAGFSLWLKRHIDRVIVSGSSIAAEWTWTATFTGDGPYGPAKDLPISGHGASIAFIENGRIKHLSDYYDTLSFFPKPKAKK